MCSDSVVTRAENEVSGTSDDELIHLAYVSTQTREMKAADLIGLLTEARGLNENRNISGLLLHKTNHFFRSSKVAAHGCKKPSITLWLTNGMRAWKYCLTSPLNPESSVTGKWAF